MNEHGVRDDYNNVLTSATPGRTVTTSYAWGDTEAEKRKHLLRQSVSPLGTVNTLQYDILRKLTKTSTLLSNQEVKTEHTYACQTGYIASISHNTDGDSAHSVVYHFGYDSLGRQTSVSMGSSVLSTMYFLHIFTRT